MRWVLSILAVLSISSTGLFAQVIYQPVRYQYVRGDHTFYYGGHNPYIFAMARSNACLASPNPLPPPVYVDQYPYGNARIYGFTPADAHNAALANLPCYFRKADLIPATGKVQRSGYFTKHTH